ncbi:MAG: agmatinase [Cyanobacteria bacterium NC_groundwater_1444_Ag_S-0.65um_54_12]|nr:agmatinase [Cyanobacteria bacterium NC_groundwater_1444_Ag_S-0.65um_54_12]
MSNTSGSTLNFGGLPAEFSDWRTARAVIIPVPYEGTTSYRSGTKEGPLAILLASRQLELYDEELSSETYRVGIATLPELYPSRRDLQAPIAQTYQVVADTLAHGKFPVVLGGEHSISAGSIQAAHEKYPDLSVLQIDAHADLRAAYDDTPQSHASVMRRVCEFKVPVTQVGIRSLSAEEMAFWRKENPSTIFWARDLRGEADEARRIVATLTPRVFLTIDVDGFDPSVIPATGTPEPGGLGWYQVLQILRELFSQREVVAADLLELAPIPGLIAPDFTCAKLIYKIIGYKFSASLQH